MRWNLLYLCVLVTLLPACVAGDADPDVVQDQAAIINNPTDPPDPDMLPPTAPLDFRSSARTTSSVTLQWTAPATATSWKLSRRLRTVSTWTTLAQGTAVAGGKTYVNAGLAEDTQYCYRLAVTNAYGSRTTPERCVLTRRTGSPLVGRLQLEVRVADVADAGTDDWVWVNLNDTVAKNFTGLYYSQDNFERGSTFTYDLNLTNVAQLHDLANITIGKLGTDAICLRGLTLRADGVTVYSRNFGNLSTTCKWLDAAAGYASSFTVPQAELRAASTFAGWTAPTRLPLIAHEEIASRLEGLVGDMLWGSDEARWRQESGRGLWIEQQSDSSLRVHLYTKADLSDLPDPRIDIAFTLHAAFVADGAGADLQLTTDQVAATASFAWWVHWNPLNGVASLFCGVGDASPGDCVDAIARDIAAAVVASFEPISRTIPFGTSKPCAPALPVATVTGNADLLFSCP